MKRFGIFALTAAILLAVVGSFTVPLTRDYRIRPDGVGDYSAWGPPSSLDYSALRPPVLADYFSIPSAQAAININATVGNSSFKKRTYRVVYDFSELGGAIAALTLKNDDADAITIPAGCITGARTNVTTAMTSGGSATVKLGITGNDDAFLAATAYNDAGFADEKMTAANAELPLKTTSAVSVLATVATAALTAGVFDLHIDWEECR